MPENTQHDVFLGAFNGFLAGCRNVDFWFLSGWWETEIHFSTPEKSPPPVRGSTLPTFFTFYVQNAPY
jgi:hypothetical protein